MAAFRLLALAFKLRRGWQRIPPERRRKLLEGAAEHARKKGPVVVKQVGEAVRNARKGR